MGPTDLSSAADWPSLGYGQVEELLTEISGGDRVSVRGRFRNLRQMPFPDEIRSGTGNRVKYGLPRILALAFVFELNAALIPQASAVALVRSTWPELVRGTLAAAVSLELIPKPKAMPNDLSGTVWILADGFARSTRPLATATNARHESAPVETADAATMKVDCTALLSVISIFLASSVADADGFVNALADLDRTFGWSAEPIPHRSNAAEQFSGTGFLDRGPYLERATAFLETARTFAKTPPGTGTGRRRIRAQAQNLLEYLLLPAPIDTWKSELGVSDRLPRLKHYLAAAAVAIGLRPPVQWPEIILVASDGPFERAGDLIRKAVAAEPTRSASSPPTNANR